MNVFRGIDLYLLWLDMVIFLHHGGLDYFQFRAFSILEVCTCCSFNESIVFLWEKGRFELFMMNISCPTIRTFPASPTFPIHIELHSSSGKCDITGVHHLV